MRARMGGRGDGEMERWREREGEAEAEAGGGKFASIIRGKRGRNERTEELDGPLPPPCSRPGSRVDVGALGGAGVSGERGRGAEES